MFVVDSGTATEDMKKKLKDGDSESFVEIEQVTGRDGDTEDLIDPVLYHEAFRRAYGGVLDEVPSLGEIESSGAGKKRTTQYDLWFKARGKEFNKTMVAQCLHRAMLDGPSDRKEAAGAQLTSSKSCLQRSGNLRAPEPAPPQTAPAAAFDRASALHAPAPAGPCRCRALASSRGSLQIRARRILAPGAGETLHPRSL